MRSKVLLVLPVLALLLSTTSSFTLLAAGAQAGSFSAFRCSPL